MCSNGLSNPFGQEVNLYLNDGTLLGLSLYTFGTTATVRDKDSLSPEICNTIKELGGKMCGSNGTVSIDVNGYKEPNQTGKDIFAFVLSDDGRLYPYGGVDYALYTEQTDLSTNTNYWRNNVQLCGTPGVKLKSTDNIVGNGCAARVIENSWTIDY